MAKADIMFLDRSHFLLCFNPNGVQGNVVSRGVNEPIIPNYKQT